jgi:hypothetical protein
MMIGKTMPQHGRRHRPQQHVGRRDQHRENHQHLHERGGQRDRGIARAEAEPARDHQPAHRNAVHQVAKQRGKHRAGRRKHGHRRHHLAPAEPELAGQRHGDERVGRGDHSGRREQQEADPDLSPADGETG